MDAAWLTGKYKENIFGQEPISSSDAQCKLGLAVCAALREVVGMQAFFGKLFFVGKEEGRRKVWHKETVRTLDRNINMR